MQANFKRAAMLGTFDLVGVCTSGLPSVRLFASVLSLLTKKMSWCSFVLRRSCVRALFVESELFFLSCCMCVFRLPCLAVAEHIIRSLNARLILHWRLVLVLSVGEEQELREALAYCAFFYPWTINQRDLFQFLASYVSERQTVMY